VLTTYLQRRDIIVLVLVIIAATLVIYWLRMRGRLAREPIQEKYPSKQALLRYVQLHYQCSEEVAYQRLAAFIKRHVPLDEQASIEYLVSYDRQRLLELAQFFLMKNPDEIDDI